MLKNGPIFSKYPSSINLVVMFSKYAKSHQFYDLLFKENLLIKSFKNRPIWSHLPSKNWQCCSNDASKYWHNLQSWHLHGYSKTSFTALVPESILQSRPQGTAPSRSQTQARVLEPRPSTWKAFRWPLFHSWDLLFLNFDRYLKLSESRYTSGNLIWIS